MTTAQSNTLEIINQLGGNKFIAMTGANNFLCADISETNPNEYLQMDLPRNTSGANRLKITININDTYAMYFYKMILKGGIEPGITKEQTFEGVYNDMLQEIFKKVTGLDTHL